MHAHTGTDLREGVEVRVAVLGVQLEQLVDVLGRLDVVEQVKVTQCQLGRHLGRVQLQLVDLTVLSTSYTTHHTRHKRMSQVTFCM